VVASLLVAGAWIGAASALDEGLALAAIPPALFTVSIAIERRTSRGR
jgi:hypothetical protein